MTESRTHHRRATQRRLVALATACSILTGAPAVAQGFYVGGGFYGYEPPPPISPRSVAFRLLDRGYSEISRPRFDGTAYVVEATNPAGARVRLFVDARDGVVLGRQRLDAPYYPAGRPARPGYGWTEEDVQARRTARAAEGLIPPGNIPGIAPTPRPQASLGPNAGRDLSSRAGAADANALGVNPDAKTHPGAKPVPEAKTPAVPPSRKTARLNEPQKPAAPRVVPAAPKLDSADKVKPSTEPDAKPVTASVEPPVVAIPASPAVEAPAPDRSSTDKPAAEEQKAAETPKVAEAPKKDEAWHDPPAGERKVRVINGATVVPGGSGESQTPSAN